MLQGHRGSDTFIMTQPKPSFPGGEYVGGEIVP